MLTANGTGKVRHAGSAIIIDNAGTYTYVNPDSGSTSAVMGKWMWIYNGVIWQPTVDFPDVPSADYSGATEAAMVEGMVTKAMLCPGRQLFLRISTAIFLSALKTLNGKTKTARNIAIQNFASSAKVILTLSPARQAFRRIL
jgi:hypothetical protein